MSTTNHSAAQQVSDVPEILEAILPNLPIRNIWTNAIPICRHWRDTIEDSIKLRRALFFKPINERRLAEISYALWDRPRTASESLRDFTDQYHRADYGPVETLWEEHKNDVNMHRVQKTPHFGYAWHLDIVGAKNVEEHDGLKAVKRLEASWRRMLICQPPVVSVRVVCKEDTESELTCPYSLTFSGQAVNKAEGLRMGDLVHECSHLTYGGRSLLSIAGTRRWVNVEIAADVVHLMRAHGSMTWSESDVCLDTDSEDELWSNLGMCARECDSSKCAGVL